MNLKIWQMFTIGCRDDARLELQALSWSLSTIYSVIRQVGVGVDVRLRASYVSDRFTLQIQYIISLL